MARFKTEMEVCPHCRRSAEATVEYSYDSDGKVTGRRVRTSTAATRTVRAARCRRTGDSPSSPSQPLRIGLFAARQAKTGSWKSAIACWTLQSSVASTGEVRLRFGYRSLPVAGATPE